MTELPGHSRHDQLRRAAEPDATARRSENAVTLQLSDALHSSGTPTEMEIWHPPRDRADGRSCVGNGVPSLLLPMSCVELFVVVGSIVK